MIMKKNLKTKLWVKVSACTLLALLSFGSAFSQAPGTFNYQAVLRDAAGAVRANTAVSIKLSMLQGSASGTVTYTETHSVTTNDLGLVTLEVGSKNTASFNAIDWAGGPYFLNIEVDGSDLGTSQILSVPYALHAAHVNSPYDDLDIEGKLDNDNANDILTRIQSDIRYNLDVNFLARNTMTDYFTEGNFHKVEFNATDYNSLLMFSTSQDKYTAIAEGVYHFSTSVHFDDLAVDTYVVLHLYVNGDPYVALSSGYSRGDYIALNGSVTLKLNASDYVEVYVYSGDVNFRITGNETHNETWFSGHLVNKSF